MNGITPEAREAAISAMRQKRQSSDQLERRQLDALIAAGWGPVSVPVRPTVEALREVLAEQFKAAGLDVDGPPYVEDGEDRWPVALELLDRTTAALLAADHLWTEPAAARDEYAAGWYAAIDAARRVATSNRNVITGASTDGGVTISTSPRYQEGPSIAREIGELAMPDCRACGWSSHETKGTREFERSIEVHRDNFCPVPSGSVPTETEGNKE